MQPATDFFGRLVAPIAVVPGVNDDESKCLAP